MFRSTEQSTFAAIIAKHIGISDTPLLLEGGVGIGKTRAYLASLIGSGLQVAVVLPTHQLIDQLLASVDLAATRNTASVAAFRPARMFERRSEYEDNKILAINAQVMLCTAASVIIDHRLGGEYNGATNRAYMLFDEADQLPDMAALQSDFTILESELTEMGIRLTTISETLQMILAKKPRTVEPEVKAAARIILDAIEDPAWYQSAGISDDGNIVLTHKLPGRLLKKVSNRGNVAFVSATLTVGGRFKDFQNSMGIEKISHLSSTIEPERHGSVDFHMLPMEIDTPEWITGIIKLANDAPKPLLIATSSHDLSSLIGEHLSAAIIRAADETASQAAGRVSATDGILISAGAWAGLDTPLRWRSIIVPRVPFGQPVVIDGEITTSYFDARNTAIRRLRQVIGRGLRTPDAVCSVYIVDARAEKLGAFVPERFTTAWTGRTYLEGARAEIVLSKAERDPALRRAALNHYGRKCKECGFVPKVDSQLDVHHIDPIAEGERRTRIEDVVVLCANCHRLAHSG